MNIELEYWNRENCSIPNKSKNAIKLKKAVENKGFTNVYIWFESLGIAMEMGGPSGGFMMQCDQNSYYPLGYSAEEAMEVISTEWFAPGTFAFPQCAAPYRDSEERQDV